MYCYENVLGKVFLTLVGVLIISCSPLAVEAQFVPVPPPVGNIPSKPDLYVAPNDETPPHVEVLTKSVGDGKNIFKVNIDDQSSISTAIIKYVNNGQIKSEPLLPRGSKLYEALIDMHSPSRVVEIQVIDAAGNILNTYAMYNITSSNDLLSKIAGGLEKLWSSFTAGK